MRFKVLTRIFAQHRLKKGISIVSVSFYANFKKYNEIIIPVYWIILQYNIQGDKLKFVNNRLKYDKKKTLGTYIS